MEIQPFDVDIGELSRPPDKTVLEPPDYDSVKEQVEANHSLINIEGYLSFTKGDKSARTILELQRLFNLEKSSQEYMPDLTTLRSRLYKIDSSLNFVSYPKHCAVKIITAENFPTENVFIALNNGSDRPANQLGFEFIEQWKAINRNIVLAFCEEVFDQYFGQN